jgi:sugar (pentulose or hexulose) kinase
VLTYAVDLGTTNTKVALYDEQLRRLAVAVARVNYTGPAPIVEFDPERLFNEMLGLINSCAQTSPVRTRTQPATIVLTGQAESLVLADASGRSLHAGISWLDSRSSTQADEIAEHFGADRAFIVTGQPASTPTLPATKLVWFQHHDPGLLERASHVLMLKDYILLRLTGQAAGELSTRAFTYLFDVRSADYWDEMVDFCGVRLDQLPDLVRPGSRLGPVLPAVADVLPSAAGWTVNVGALDHFAGMVGTGSYRSGVVSESAGTVLSLSILLDGTTFDPAVRASYHRGVRGEDMVLFDCCDSGGICLDWFAAAAGAGVSLSELDSAVASRPSGRDAPLFLPQITGVNPPDFLPDARAAFLDLNLGTDGADLAYAVMEGVAHLLRSNVDYCRTAMGPVTDMVSTGGGTASRFWTQLKANICDVRITVPDEPEATCRGAAVLGLVNAGLLGNLSDAHELTPVPTAIFLPSHTVEQDLRYARYRSVLRNLYGRNGA